MEAPTGLETAGRARARGGVGLARCSTFPLLLALVVGCGPDDPAGGDAEELGPAAAAGDEFIAYSGVAAWDGEADAPIPDALLLVRGGRVEWFGPAAEAELPPGTRAVELDGRFLLPGFVNGHGHVGAVDGLESDPANYTREHLERQLRLYARYGVTTVVSLGGDGPEAVELRDEQASAALNRARIFVAGPVLSPSGPDEAAGQVDRVAELGGDWVKIRVDDQLGQGAKMSRETYGAVIRAGRDRGLPLAAHIVQLEDAIGVVEEGARLVAHSVRDREVAGELPVLMRERGVCITPTLTRELSTFVYGDRPDFFDDPFFLAEVSPEVIRQLEDPDRQASVRASQGAQYYESQLPVAMENLRILHEAGVGVALGTDSGPPARFQGYFEHLEMTMMVDAGMTPDAVLRSATGMAARCLGLEGEVGTLAPDAWADFVVLDEDPWSDILNTRSIRSVWVAGNRIDR